MPSVVCLGELLVDMLAGESDVSLAQAKTFIKAPGGAPANVAVGVVRLGERAGFVGAIGNDFFGEFLDGVIRQAGVDTSRLVRINDVRTSLAFIAARSDGRKDITFYRNPGADMMLAPAHIDDKYISTAEVFHFGSISRIDDSPRAATDKACQLALRNNALITYDPNYRPSLWPDPVAARKRIGEGFSFAKVAKISLEEWEFITGTDDFSEGASDLMNCGVQLVVRSEGEHGASFATKRCSGHAGGFSVSFVEATGAGDGFMACLIVELLAHWRRGDGPGDLDKAELARIVTRANAVGAIACTKVGAIPSLPTAAEVDAFLGENNKRARLTD